jgi:hypothetical protein
MHTKKDGLYRVLLLVFALVLGIAGFAGASNLFPTFADDHTVAMWLFDEGYYPHTTLTDAGKYEYDLRLQDGGRLVEGRFGNALKVQALWVILAGVKCVRRTGFRAACGARR